MIQISLTQALLFYSVLLGFLMAAIWTYAELTARRHQRFLAKQFLWRCVFCGYTYLDEAAERVSQCPRCESFNALDDKRARFVAPRGKKPAAPSHSVPSESRRNPSRRKRPGQRRRGPRKR